MGGAPPGLHCLDTSHLSPSAPIFVFIVSFVAVAAVKLRLLHALAVDEQFMSFFVGEVWRSDRMLLAYLLLAEEKPACDRTKDQLK